MPMGSGLRYCTWFWCTSKIKMNHDKWSQVKWIIPVLFWLSLIHHAWHWGWHGNRATTWLFFSSDSSENRWLRFDEMPKMLKGCNREFVVRSEHFDIAKWFDYLKWKYTTCIYKMNRWLYNINMTWFILVKERLVPLTFTLTIGS